MLAYPQGAEQKRQAGPEDNGGLSDGLSAMGFQSPKLAEAQHGSQKIASDCYPARESRVINTRLPSIICHDRQEVLHDVLLILICLGCNLSHIREAISENRFHPPANRSAVKRAVLRFSGGMSRSEIEVQYQHTPDLG